MTGIICRLAIVLATALAPLAFVIPISPGVSNAADCGQGTLYDPGSDTCVVAEQPQPVAEQSPLVAEQPPPPPPPRVERSHAARFGQHLRAHSVGIAVRRYLGPRRCWQPVRRKRHQDGGVVYGPPPGLGMRMVVRAIIPRVALRP